MKKAPKKKKVETIEEYEEDAISPLERKDALGTEANGFSVGQVVKYNGKEFSVMRWNERTNSLVCREIGKTESVRLIAPRQLDKTN